MAEKPLVFIASSPEQIQIAHKIKKALEDPRSWTVQVWDKKFNFSKVNIESLEEALDLADFAIVVLTGDDPGQVRKEVVVLPRDNVIFELGLFIGRLGRDRCFFYVDAASGTKIASDLSGVKEVKFYPDTEADPPEKPSLHTQALTLRKQMRALIWLFLSRGRSLPCMLGPHAIACKPDRRGGGLIYDDGRSS